MKDDNERKEMERSGGHGGDRHEGRRNRTRPEYGKPNTNVGAYGLQVGFFAGLIWGVVNWVCYQLNLTAVVPGFIIEPFFLSSFLKTWTGIAVGIGGFIVFSIVATFIYYFLLGKIRGPWAGIAYGLVWWAVLFVAAGPVLQMVKPVTLIGWDTLTTELCLFALWGLFIGYTIAYEFTDEASREPIHAR
ncbi:YqhR family membrane protein [Paenibacillus thailandensis]|uniref:YqhR family membrane protein n=1 Tax=Paenibacillus thailandensis TaxID=393250 RepID=A0ABW5QYH7_9BACL